MSEKKIAETVNVRINIGNYQHIEISKYAEREISYDTQEEMVQKEDELTQELLDNLVRNMRRIPEKIGKGEGSVEKAEERISKAIPDWMKGNEEPNLAKKSNVSSAAEEKENEDQKASKAAAVVTEREEIDELLGSSDESKADSIVEAVTSEEDELF